MENGNDWPEWDPNYGFDQADDEKNKPVDPDAWAKDDDWEGDY